MSFKGRIRTGAHYTAGFRDGNVKAAADKQQSVPRNEDSESSGRVEKMHALDERIQGNRNNINRNRQNWESGFAVSQGGDVSYKDPWEFSAFALIASVVLMGALFLHIASETKEKKVHHSKRRHRSRPPIRINKKTDEWIDDEDVAAMEEALSLASSGQVKESMRPPSLYYPHQPIGPRLQQRIPQRVMIGNVGQQSSPLPQTVSTARPPTGNQPSLNATIPPQHLYPGDAFVTGSYYMHPSGGALYRSPASSFRDPSRAGVLPASPQQLTPISQHSSSDYFSVTARPTAPHDEDETIEASNRAHPKFESSIARVDGLTSSFPTPIPPKRAVALSSRLSSFESLTDAAKNHHVDEETGTPQPSPPVSSHSDRKSNILLSPGTEDVDEAILLMSESSRGRSLLPDLVGETPRVANRCIAKNSRDVINRYYPRDSSSSHSDPWLSHGLQPPTDTSLAFASPPKKRHNQDNSNNDGTGSPDLPFVPSLGARRNQGAPPPKSINLDELQLQQMESGSMSHWVALETEESIVLEEKKFPGTSKELEIALSNASSSERIPSGDPRAGIDHKRPSLIIDTNSAASLQGAIDFNRLELIEVIGGGGFGQVWKAKLRGTPVAVKVLTGSAQAKNVPRAVLEEFAAEINLLKGMQHPNICLYMGACIEPPNRAIVTELAANGSLWDALRLPLSEPFVACDGKSSMGWPSILYMPDSRHGAPPSSQTMKTSQQPIPPRYTWPWVLVKKVAIGVARGMAYLHGGEPPVLHRDLKSANILLDESYNPKVCDFGLSRLKAKERSMVSASVSFIHRCQFFLSYLTHSPYTSALRT